MLVAVLTVMAVCVRVSAGFLLIGKILQPEEEKSKRFVDFRVASIISLLVGAILGIVRVVAFSEAVPGTAVEVIGMLVLSALLWHYEYRVCFFIAFLYEIAVGLLQFLSGAGISLALADARFMDTGVLEGQIAVWLGCVGAVFATIWFYVKKREENGRSPVVSFVAVAFIFGIITIDGQERVPISQDLIFVWTILAYTFLVGILLFRITKQYEKEKKLAQVTAEQAELLEKKYVELNNAYSANARLFHDFHNHIGMIRKLVVNGKNEETVAYLDDLQAPVKELTDSKWTGDDAIDYLINGKVAAAKEYGIEMQLQVEYPRNSDIKSVDMCTIIGNLADNAIEATKQVTNAESRFIKLAIRRINQMLIIKVENRFESELRTENGQLKTTKMEGGIHGWGIRSVRTAAEKYEGTVQTSQDGNVFKVVVTLSFQGIQAP